jgi:hypothetical protein
VEEILSMGEGEASLFACSVLLVHILNHAVICFISARVTNPNRYEIRPKELTIAPLKNAEIELKFCVSRLAQKSKPSLRYGRTEQTTYLHPFSFRFSSGLMRVMIFLSHSYKDILTITSDYFEHKITIRFRPAAKNKQTTAPSGKGLTL